MGMKTRYRRLEALEKSRAATEEACNTKIRNVLYRISREHTELLIDATLALHQGRELTAGEAAARQAYAAALEWECRGSGWAPRRMPTIPELISEAVLCEESEDDLLLSIGGYRALIAGFEPTAAQSAAIASHCAAEAAQYRRTGFSSQADCERWYADRHPAPLLSYSCYSHLKRVPHRATYRLGGRRRSKRCAPVWLGASRVTSALAKSPRYATDSQRG
jgi:hypothetical protein